MSLTSLNVDSRPEWEGRGKLTNLSELPVVTILLIALNVLVFLAMVFRGVPFFDPRPNELIRWGANFGPLTTSGQWWRLLTACFLHAGVIHLGMNMYILLQVGVLTEAMFGSTLFLLLYLVSGICGNIAGLFLHPFTTSVGASGAIFGLYGGLFAFLLIRRAHLPPERSRSILSYAGVFLLYNLIYGLATPTTDLVAHGGGLISGFIFGCPLALLRGPAKQRRYLLSFAACLGLTALLGIAVWKVPRSSPAQSEFFRRSISGQTVSAGLDGKLIYAGTITRPQAEAAAAVLVEAGYFRAAGHSAYLQRDAGSAALSIPLQSRPVSSSPNAQAFRPTQPWDEPAFLGAFEFFGPQLASAAGGLPFEIRFVDERGELRKTIRVDRNEIAVGNGSRVGYSGDATAKDAVALANALRSMEVFKKQSFLVYLNKHGGVPEITFFVNDDHWEDPKLNAAFANIGGHVAGALGGPPLNVVLVNNSRKEQRTIAIRSPDAHTVRH